MSDPTDPGGVARRPARARSARVGDTGSPLATPVTIGLAVLLVVGGFFILRSVRDDTTFAVGSPEIDAPPVLGDPADAPPVDSTPVDEPPAPTAAPEPPAPTRTGATVQVANASRVGGSAASMTSTLATAGFTTATATDVNRSIVGEAALTDSLIYYVAGDAAAAAVAQQLATDLGVAATNVQSMPEVIPTSSGTLGSTTVLLLLGTAQVNKTIAPAAGVAVGSGGQSLLPPVPGGNTGG